MAGGAYAAIYASLLWHRKVLAIPESDRLAAFGFYSACCAYCQLNRTDGYLAYAQLVAVFPCTEGERKRLGRVLIDAALFDRGEGGIQIHDWLDHNKSKAEIETGRKAMSDGGKKSGETRRKASSKVPSEPTIRRSAEKSSDESAESEEALSLDPDPKPEGSARGGFAPAVPARSDPDLSGPAYEW